MLRVYTHLIATYYIKFLFQWIKIHHRTLLCSYKDAGRLDVKKKKTKKQTTYITYIIVIVYYNVKKLQANLNTSSKCISSSSNFTYKKKSSIKNAVTQCLLYGFFFLHCKHIYIIAEVIRNTIHKYCFNRSIFRSLQ